MNDFEFLRDLPIGQYLPGRSIIHRLDPRARIIITVVFLGALTFSTATPGLAIGLAAALGAWGLARLAPRPVWKAWRVTMPFLLILSLLQVIFQVGPDQGTVVYAIGPVTVTSVDLIAALNLVIRFSAYLAALTLASSILTTSEITRGLAGVLKPFKIVRFPVHDFVTMIMVSLRFFPLLAQSAERIAKAQASRGADWNARAGFFQRIRQRMPLLVPLFVTSLRRAESMALAMDARAFDSGIERTSMVELKFQGRDWLALAAGLLVSAAVLLVR